LSLANLLLNIVTASVVAFIVFKVAVSLKTRISNIKNRLHSHENAFKGFVRDRNFSSNFWGMVKAYRERLIKKLGWNE